MFSSQSLWIASNSAPASDSALLQWSLIILIDLEWSLPLYLYLYHSLSLSLSWSIDPIGDDKLPSISFPIASIGSGGYGEIDFALESPNKIIRSAMYDSQSSGPRPWGNDGIEPIDIPPINNVGLYTVRAEYLPGGQFHEIGFEHVIILKLDRLRIFQQLWIIHSVE